MQFPIPLLPETKLTHNGVYWRDETHPLPAVSAQDAKAYDERSATFDLQKAFEVRRPHFTDPLRHNKEGIIVEIAAGRAAHSLRLLRDGYHVLVSDISPKTVEWVQRTAHQLQIDERGSFAVLNGQSLPFADHSIEGLFMTASLHHLPSAADALKEFHRVLKPGGVLLVGYEPAKWSYRLFSPIWNVLKKKLRRHHEHREVSIADDVTEGFSMGELRAMAREAGFRSVDVRAVDFLEKIYEHVIVLMLKLFGKPDSEYRPGSSILRAIDGILGKIPLIKRTAWNYDLIAVT